jgi:hypothetical protein
MADQKDKKSAATLWRRQQQKISSKASNDVTSKEQMESI